MEFKLDFITSCSFKLFNWYINEKKKYFLKNSERNRLKRFWKYENILCKENDFMEIDFDYIL